MDTRWLLLIYTVPAQPSRQRAWVWREVKRAGAEYPPHGVCILPQRAAPLEHDLAKLRRWADQVRARDDLDSPQAATVSGMLERCDSALGVFLDTAAEAQTAAR